MLRLMLLVVPILTLTACGPSKSVKEMEDPNSSLIFGYIGRDDGPVKFDWVQLRHSKPGAKDIFIESRADRNGLFYAENLSPGHYQIHRYGWGVRPLGENVAHGGGGAIFTFPKTENLSAMHIKGPGLKYMGTFMYTRVKTGFFEGGKFTIDRTTTPSEKELLQKLLRYTKNTKWEASVKERLANMK